MPTAILKVRAEGKVVTVEIEGAPEFDKVERHEFATEEEALQAMAGALEWASIFVRGGVERERLLQLGKARAREIEGYAVKHSLTEKWWWFRREMTPLGPFETKGEAEAAGEAGQG